LGGDTELAGIVAEFGGGVETDLQFAGRALHVLLGLQPLTTTAYPLRVLHAGELSGSFA